MDPWLRLLDVLMLVGIALVLGILAEQLRQSAIVGYLLAGLIAGPNVLGIVGAEGELDVVAELGAALLLFTIGLEFSFQRLLRSGRTILLGGTGQVVLTLLLGFAASRLLGLPTSTALALGAVGALSSTAFVSRVLMDRFLLDHRLGRSAIGILLLQDLAVVPLALLVASLSAGQAAEEGLLDALRAGLLGLLGFALLYLAMNHLVPRVFHLRSLSKNRDLPILLAVVLALGSTFGAHEIGLTPAVGAFAAGLLLAESPFAVQVRSDLASLRTLLVTLFFAAIGTFADPRWAVENLSLLLAVVVLVVVGKTLIVSAILRLLAYPWTLAAATGLTLAQIGEFSFVLAQIGRSGGLFEDDLFRLVIAGSVVSLFLTPYLVTAATRLQSRPQKPSTRARGQETAALRGDLGAPPVLIVGFGPAGQAAAQALLEEGFRVSVLDINPKNRREADEMGVGFHVGDATHVDVLERLGVKAATGVLVTIPEPVATERITKLVRFLGPDVPLVARARYHFFVDVIQAAGASGVVDEETEVGLHLAAELSNRSRAVQSGGRDTVRD